MTPNPTVVVTIQYIVMTVRSVKSPGQFKPLPMPELARIIHGLLADNVLPQLPRRLVGLGRIGGHCFLGEDVGPHDARVQQHHNDALVLQVHSHALADGIDGRLGRPVCVVSAGAVVCDGADAAGNDADFGVSRLQHVGEEGLCEEQRAERVDRERPLQDVEVGRGQTVRRRAGRNTWTP